MGLSDLLCMGPALTLSLSLYIYFSLYRMYTFPYIGCPQLRAIPRGFPFPHWSREGIRIDSLTREVARLLIS